MKLRMLKIKFIQGICLEGIRVPQKLVRSADLNMS